MQDTPPTKIIKTVLAELDQWKDEDFVEPFVAAAFCNHQVDGDELLFICRTYAHAGSGVTGGGVYASYLSPYGQIVAKKPGQAHEFNVELNGRIIAHHRSNLIWKCLLEAKYLEGAYWDGTNARIEWVGGGLALPSLRKYDGQPHEVESFRRRQLTVQLPDQAILDEVQDAIFRLPMNERVLIFGAPGTGKTTVQLKRLSQKTKWDFLTQEERQLFRSGEWKSQDWILFTPNDLLKYYLKEAMAKEDLPASEAHLKVYSSVRLEILRECGVLKVVRGVFRSLPNETTLLNSEAPATLASLNKSFERFLQIQMSRQIHDRLGQYRTQIDPALTHLEELGSEAVKSAETKLAQTRDQLPIDDSEIRLAEMDVKSAKRSQATLAQLVSIFNSIGVLPANSATITAAHLYSRHLRIAVSLNEARRIVGEHDQETLLRKAKPSIDILITAANLLHENLSLRALLDDFPRHYQRFRLDEVNRSTHFRTDSTADLEINPGLSLAEQDLLLLRLLDTTRELIPLIPKDRNGVPKALSALLDRFRVNVCIDEAADFSPLEIACMERFSLPKVGGVTLSGDLMQRVTQGGLRTWDDLDFFSGPYQRCQLTIGYRQSARLFQIARKLCSAMGVPTDSFQSAYQTQESDPPPLAVQLCGNDEISDWLAKRVFEIFDICEDTLPTIAILMPTNREISPLFEALKPRLSESGIELEESLDGKLIGDSSRVRIFPVEAIKGLEFEAVFYVGIDRMAQLHSNLIDKFLYVGLSRARSFLGVTYEQDLPSDLATIESLFLKQPGFSLHS